MTGSERVDYVTSREQVPPEGRRHFDDIVESRGSIPGPYAVLLNSPELAGRAAHLGAYVRFESELVDDVRETAILTTARAFDCAYVWAAHVPIAREAGVPEPVIDAVADAEPTGELSEPPATVVAYGRELLGEHEVSSTTFDRALDAFGESGVTELTATLGYYALMACTLNAFEVLPDDGDPRVG